MKYGDLVSVIVPVYNRAHLIGRSVGSLVAQSYANLDIILVDDCSDDGLKEAVAALADDRIRLIRRARNGGASAARNTGIAQAKGDLIAFHDSDDLCIFDKIERQVRALEKLPEDYIGVYSSVLFYADADEDSYGEMRITIRPNPGDAPLSGNMYQRTVAGNAMNLPTMLLRKSAVLATGGFDEALGNNNDWDFALRLTRLGKFHFLPEPLYLSPFALSKSAQLAHISGSQRFSARSFAVVTGKLRRQGERSPQIAGHYNTTARFLLREGRPRAARRYLCAALSIRPFHLRSLLLYVLSYSDRLRRALSRVRKQQN